LGGNGLGILGGGGDVSSAPDFNGPDSGAQYPVNTSEAKLPGFNLTRSYYPGTKGAFSLNLNGSVTETIPLFSDGIQDATSDFVNALSLLNAPRDLFMLGTAIVGTSARTAGTIATRGGLIAISEHLSQFGPDAANSLMYSRLAGAFERGEALTGVDAAFYEHELIEAGLMDAGMAAREAHLETLQIQGLTYARGVEYSLYTPEAIKLFNPGY
jgi:hypothetical protein